MASSTSSSRRRRRLWRFAGAVFDEAGWVLRIDGQPVTLEGKPLEVLHELLLRAGEVVTKEEVLEAVWPQVTVEEGSLATAVSKLRRALGESRASVIETVPRVGYRLNGEVSVETTDAPLAPRFAFSPGEAVPGRPQWRLDRPLGDSGTADVWLARHAKTGEPRVFKFADAPDRLRGLKREAALSRLLAQALSYAAPQPALLEWNFETTPYFLEYAYGGHDLIGWAAQGQGLAARPLSQRLEVAARLSRAVAMIHSVGVLHKDLKPANILISDGEAPAIRLADFGSGRLLHAALLDRYRVTDPGSLNPEASLDDSRSGTLAYRAPELIGDTPPTMKSDVFALGLILFQLVVGDFTRSLAPGWEKDVSDPLLRRDIAEAAEGDPARRLASAGDLAERLERLDERRRAEAERARHQALLAEATELAERRRVQRPWIQAAAAALIVGLIGTTAFAAYAVRQRDQARAATELAEIGFRFIAEDVLASPDPVKSSADETVVEAIKRASRDIDQRFGGSPDVAARLHLAVARAFTGRSDFDTARAEFIAADRLFAEAGLAGSDDAALGRLGRIHMEALSGQPGRLAEAGRLLDLERRDLTDQVERGVVGFALAQAEGAHAYMADLDKAEPAFRRAMAIGEAEGSGVPATQVLKAKSSLVLTLMRLGRAAEAEPVARAVLAQSEQLRGADHPDTLVTRQHWLTSLSMMGRHQDALNASGPLLLAMERRFGPEHRFPLALRSVRFESYAALNRHDEAAYEAEKVWRGATSQAGASSHQAIVGQIDFASALCQTSRRREGARIAEQALTASRDGMGADYPLTHVVRFFLAECQIANDQFDAAARSLDGLDRTKLVELTGQPAYAAQVDLALAEIARHRRP